MSSKTSNQPGRRTPLSLSGAVTKSNPNKGNNNSANVSGTNTNGHATSTTNKQDNKLQQLKNDIQIVNNPDIRENSAKRQQQPQTEKKQQQNDNKKLNEKNQNGVNNSKQANETKQLQHNKEKHHQQQQQQNGNEEKKLNDKDKKEDKSENVEEKVGEEKSDQKKEEKKSKDIKEGASKNDIKNELQNQAKNIDINSKGEIVVKNQEEEKAKQSDNVEDQQMHQKVSTPVTTRNSHKVTTPVHKTPTKVIEKGSQKTPTKNSSPKSDFAKRDMATTIDDNDCEMEPLAIESSPIKSSQPEEITNIKIAPSATSTPGKIYLPKRAPKGDVQLAMQTGLSPERPRAFSQISGRKSIRPLTDFTPSKFQSNSQFRESYRRINTELDVTNTSMNVTVGSEVPSNFSFSFFGRGRKRDRTPPRCSQSVIGDLQTDMDMSPPKKARLDMHGFFSVVSSPLSLLRNRFAKASLKNTTPVKLDQKLTTNEDEVEVQNVSGVSVQEEIPQSEKGLAESNTTVSDVTLGVEANEIISKVDVAKGISTEPDLEGRDLKEIKLNGEKTCDIEQTSEGSGTKTTENLLQTAVGDPLAKNKRCVVM